MTKNGTKGVAEKEASAGAMTAIERRLAELKRQRETNAQQRQQLAEQLQRLATEDVAAQGAILTLEALLAEMATLEQEAQ